MFLLQFVSIIYLFYFPFNVTNAAFFILFYFLTKENCLDRILRILLGKVLSHLFSIFS